MTKAELFTSIGEPFAAGLFELEGAGTGSFDYSLGEGALSTDKDCL